MLINIIRDLLIFSSVYITITIFTDKGMRAGVIMSLRNERVRKTLMKEISDIIMKELKDSRIHGVVSITDIEIAHDNSFAKVYYSVFATEEEKQTTIKAIEENTSKIRYEVGKRVRLRLTPELRFIPDNSLERGANVTAIINKISKAKFSVWFFEYK